MLAPADEAILRRLVGSTTFTRGQAYARQGAVRRVQWTKDGACVSGEVQGGARSPYGVSVIVRRSKSHRIVGIDAICTCPVEINCKHAGGPSSRRRRRAGCHPETPGHRPEAGRHGAREDARLGDPLQTLMARTGPGPAASEPSEIGLQFELVMTPPKTRTASQPSAPGIRARPVLRSYNGTWVRTGISWSRLEYIAYRRSVPGRSVQHLTVLTELLALSRLSIGRQYYASSDEAVWLQTINSRRLWDLLTEARDLELPMLQAGRHAGPIDLRVGPAAVTLDAIRVDAGLELRSRVRIDDEEVPLASSLLVGKPAHGIAWWDGASEPPGIETRLTLAPFAAPVDEGLRRFLASTPFGIPRRDEQRFMADFYPALRRRIDVASSDASVDLPELPPAHIVLTVTHYEGHRVALDLGPGSVGIRRARRPLGRAERNRRPERRGRHRRSRDDAGALRTRAVRTARAHPRR